MAAPRDREGLSPPTAQRLVGALEEDDEDYSNDDEYHPADNGSGSSRLNSTAEDEDEEDRDYTDASENLANIEVEIENIEDEEDGAETERENNGGRPAGAATAEEGARSILIDLNQILSDHTTFRRLLGQRHRVLQTGRGRIVFIGGGGHDYDDDYDDDDYEDEHVIHRRRAGRRSRPTGDRYPKIPSDNGRELMNSGIYGQRDSFSAIRRRRRTTFSEKLMWRRLGLDARSHSRKASRILAQELVPSSSQADRIIRYDSPAYCGQFSDDGNFFFSCTQNFKVRMYDTANVYDWKYYKTVEYPFGQWTITDGTLSPDNRFLAYSSIRHIVCLAPTDPTGYSDPTLLDFNKFAADAQGNGASRTRHGYMGRSGFGIWSIRFSGDGREIVAGTSDQSVIVYDIERGCSTVRLSNHDDHVNAVCFGDKSSPHILYSGSDDQTLRVWDRRSMAAGQEAGIFVGHTEGLTYVDSKGDGRYVLSNGKDQTMKLWDLRKMVSPSAFSQMDLSRYTTGFDYRHTPYDEDDYQPNPDDCSVVTFRGHRVLRTLIRCHFSPPGSSNGRYVYSGSEDGNVWIYNLDGTVRAKIDVTKATKNLGLQARIHERGWKTCVRDASWSPTAPVLAATSWNGYNASMGTVSQHSWNDGAEDDEGDPEMIGGNYNAKLEALDDLNDRRRDARTRDNGRLRSNPVPRRRLGQEEEDEDWNW